MVSVPKIALGAWNFIWTLLALSLVSNVIADAFSGNPSSVNYAEFVAVIAMVIVLIDIASAFTDAVPGMVTAILDIIASIASFIAGVVLAAKLGVHSCGNTDYLLSNNLTNGSHDPSKRCHELQASTAFFWFMFVGFLANAVLGFTGGSSSGFSGRGGLGRKRPSMSQV